MPGRSYTECEPLVLCRGMPGRSYIRRSVTAHS